MLAARRQLDAKRCHSFQQPNEVARCHGFRRASMEKLPLARPCVHSWAHLTGAWRWRRRRSSVVVGVRPSLWGMALIAAAGRCGKKSERRPDESFRRSTRGQVWRIAPKSCGLWSGVECPRWSTLLSVVDSFGGQGRVGQRPPTVTCCQFVHRVYARQNCFFFLPPLSVCLSACSLNSPLHKLSFWPAQPN